MSYDRSAVRAVIEAARAGGRNALSPAECRALCEACAIPLPKAATASSAAEAGRAASALGFPVVMKIVSPDILHKTEAGGVVLNVRSAAEAERAYEKIVAGARAYKPDAKVAGVEIQQMLSGGQEVIVGATDDPSFGKVVAFGLGGVLVEVLKDITFRLAPASRDDALSMIDGIAAAEILNGVRGAAAVDKGALAAIIETVSILAADFPEIAEIDLNPILARPDGAVALDVRVLLDFAPPRERFRPSREEILRAMNRIMRPDGDRGHRRVGRGRQDRQLGDEEPHQRRLRGQDLSDPSQAAGSDGAQGLSQRQGGARARSTSRCSRSRRRWSPARSRSAARKKFPARC